MLSHPLQDYKWRAICCGRADGAKTNPMVSIAHGAIPILLKQQALLLNLQRDDSSVVKLHREFLGWKSGFCLIVALLLLR
jgi:hypothetical protein